MTLQEAIKSGRKFSRKFRSAWISPSDEYFSSISFEDILATDWEVESEPLKKRELSAKDIREAAQLINSIDYVSSTTINALIKTLGLE